MAKKKVGSTQSAGASHSEATAMHCHVCNCSFKRPADLHTHGMSKQHREMLSAYDRGTSNACAFAFTLCRSALLYYPVPSSSVTSVELPSEQASFAAAQLNHFLSSKSAK